MLFANHKLSVSYGVLPELEGLIVLLFGDITIFVFNNAFGLFVPIPTRPLHNNESEPCLVYSGGLYPIPIPPAPIFTDLKCSFDLVIWHLNFNELYQEESQLLQVIVISSPLWGRL